MIELNEHEKAYADELKEIASDAKESAKNETGNLARSLTIVFGVAAASAVALNALDSIYQVTPYFKMALGFGTALSAVTTLTFHSMKTSFYQSVSKTAKTKEMDVRDGIEPAKERLPRIEDIEKEVRNSNNPTDYLDIQYYIRASAIAIGVGTASVAFVSASKENIVLPADRSREQQATEEKTMVAPSVMSEPPRQPLAPVLR
mgnify:CR=1 FL=1